jgi:hypothetical protein
LDYINSQQYDQAESVLRKYMEIQPNSILGARRLAAVLLHKNQQAESKQWLIKADELEENSLRRPAN